MADQVRPADVRRAAMDYLARREHSRRELMDKLQEKYPSAGELAEETVDKLAEEGLQSDARLAEAFVRARASRGQGPIRIRSELRGKGVADDVIELALDARDVDWFALVEEVARKRFGEEKPPDARERARRIRFLQQRGFSFDHIKTLD